MITFMIIATIIGIIINIRLQINAQNKGHKISVMTIVKDTVTRPKHAIELLIKNPGKEAPLATSNCSFQKSLKTPLQASKILVL